MDGPGLVQPDQSRVREFRTAGICGGPPSVFWYLTASCPAGAYPDYFKVDLLIKGRQEMFRNLKCTTVRPLYKIENCSHWLRKLFDSGIAPHATNPTDAADSTYRLVSGGRSFNNPYLITPREPST